MAKKNLLKTILGISIGALAITATVSLIQKLNKPGKEPSISVPSIPEQEERKNLATFNFVTTSDNVSLDTQEKVIAFMSATTTNNKASIFGTLLETEVEENNVKRTTPYAIKLFQSKELGLRVGSSSALGGLGISMNDGFTFNHARVSATNYHRLKTAAEEDGTFNYSKNANGSSYTLNSKPVSLPANADLKVADDVIETTFEFETEQNTLTIAGTSGRPCILSLELWTE